jgi:lambda repressor-like predicted transcriptional regulator
MDTKMTRRPEFLAAQMRQRKKDAAEALARGECMMDLSKKWGVSRPCVSEWCARNISREDRRALAENGYAKSDHNRNVFGTSDRLELVALCREKGWTDARISRALGISRAGLCQWLKRNAPDGIDDALSDYRDEEAA